MPMIDTKYRYSVESPGEYDDAYTLRIYDWQIANYDLEDKYDLETLAEACAEDYHSNRDGWECRSWNNGNEPLNVYIWTSETTNVHYEVWLEYSPRFSARKAESDE
jgi:hypothetical protein